MVGYRLRNKVFHPFLFFFGLIRLVEAVDSSLAHWLDVTGKKNSLEKVKNIYI